MFLSILKCFCRFEFLDNPFSDRDWWPINVLDQHASAFVINTYLGGKILLVGDGEFGLNFVFSPDNASADLVGCSEAKTLQIQSWGWWVGWYRKKKCSESQLEIVSSLTYMKHMSI